MKDQNKTKKQLVNELVQLRLRIAELKTLENERKQIEGALRRSEERYRTILENIQEGYFEVDLAGNFTFLNDARCRELGYTRDELIGMNNRQYTDKETARRVFQAFNKTYRTGQPVKGLDEEIIRKDGTKAFREISASLIRDSEGKPVGFRGISRDITERKRAEEEYRTILRTTMDGFWTADMHGRFLDVNDAYCQLIGYSRDELLTMRISDVEAVERPEETAQRIQRIMEVGGDRFETRHKCKDGRIIDIEVSVNYMEVGGGRMFVFLRDVTEHKRAEETLLESESRFHLLVEHSTDTLLLHDFDGKIIDVNRHACESLGYTREELLGLSIQDIDQDFIFGGHTEKWKQMVPGVPITLEGVHKRKDGTTYPVEVRLGVFELGGRKLMLGLVRDITERKGMEEEREKLIHELQDALVNVKTLSGLLPICSHCKKIRDDKGYWNQIESYIREHSGAEFTHGMCPECMKKLYPDLVD